MRYSYLDFEEFTARGVDPLVLGHANLYIILFLNNVCVWVFWALRRGYSSGQEPIACVVTA
jgi:hypothetical protein